MIDYNNLPNDCLNLIKEYAKPKIKPLFRFESGQTFIMNKDEFIRINKAEYLQRQDKTRYIKLDCEYVNYSRRSTDRCERIKPLIEIEYNDNFNKYNMELILNNLDNIKENYIGALFCDETQKANMFIITYNKRKYINHDINMTKFNCCYTKKSLLELHRLTRDAVEEYGGQLNNDKIKFNKYVKFECEELFKFNCIHNHIDISIVIQSVDGGNYALLKVNGTKREFEDTDPKFYAKSRRSLNML